MNATRSRTVRMLAALAATLVASPALAQTGVDDDRVSLPEGPGSLEGVGDNVEIDPNMGSMSYSVPIVVPVGRNGMVPAAGLSYSSSGQAGLVGVGWSVPTPSIGRLTSRGVPTYGTEDVFVIDGGDELVHTSDADGNQVYRQRFEGSFDRHTWVAPGEGKGGHWVVEMPDGTKSYYGADKDGVEVASARLQDAESRVAEYRLVDTVDPFGNVVHYEYELRGSNVPLLSQISYVFVDGTPTYTIEYTYEDRPDTISDANVGFETLLGSRLTGVVVRFEDQIVREYALAYETEMASGGLSRLASVSQWGLGGQAGGVLNPIAFSFEYQKGLGVECTEANCDKPFLVDMGSVGVSLGSGRATLIDINGDALPDVLDSSQAGNHRFIINELTAMPDGSFTYGFASPVTSSVSASSSFLLGDNVQTLDVDGDSYSDLVNTSTGAFLLKDPDANDWLDPGASIDVGPLPGIDFANAKFFDYDNDKRIDVLVSNGGFTQVIANDGSTFAAVDSGIDTIGVSFSDESVEMADINGDGMTDPVEVVAGSGELRYRANLGRGRFAPWRSLTGVSIAGSERDIYDLEDLNGDGRDDIVIVTSGQVKYALNRGTSFDPYVTITDVDGALPDRPATTSVLYADMNANGSEDVVWFDSTGNVKFLELFPQRPNLLSRTDNGIGFVQKVTYSTAAEQAALAARDGEAWESLLQIPMAVVTTVDNYVLLTGDDDGGGLHDVVTYDYTDGFYDGAEKQYRGFEFVTTRFAASDSQEGGAIAQLFDVGRDDPHFNGLTRETTTYSGGRELRADAYTYAGCALDDSIPSAAELEALGRKPVAFVCKTGETSIVKEGSEDTSAWLTERRTFEYDVWGNLTKTIDEGVVGVDGDEATVETTYASPDAAWFLRLPLTESRYTTAGGRRTETNYYYDGADYDGAQSGITQGFLTRVTTKADDQTTLETLRQKPDAFGNIASMLDARAQSADDASFERVYEYDTYGLFVTSTTLRNLDAAGELYELVRESRYDYRFQKASSVNEWTLVKDGADLTPTNTNRVTYDELGRVATRAIPTDGEDTPTFTHDYALGERFTTVTLRSRSEANGALDREVVICLDGRGREYQQRLKVGDGRYLVTGFTAYNSRGAEVSSYQPYESDSAACEETEPAGVGVTTTTYDALFRPIERTIPDGDIYGDASVERWAYEPFVEIYSDVEDTDEAGAHTGTPLLRRRDGLGRIVEIQRSWIEDDALQTSSYELLYDDVTNFAGYVDPQGNRHEMVVDLAGRIAQVTNPNFGTLSMVYDAAGNVVSKTDSRGVTTEQTYDNLNRMIERVDPARADETRVRWSYDFAGSCDPLECTQLAGRLARVDFPLAGGLTGNQRFGYDSRGRPIFVAQSYEDLSLALRVTHDNFDEALSVTQPDGTVLEMGHDDMGRVTSVDGFLDAITYDARGKLSGIDYANGASASVTFDAMIRAQTLTHKDAAGSIIESWDLTRDRIGNVVSIADASERADRPSPAGSLTYDDWYRLVRADTTHESDQAESIDYVYDELDNILSLTSTLGAQSRAHVGVMTIDESAPNQVTQAGDVGYTYDAFGQVVSRGGVEMTWDHDNRLTSFGGADYLYGPDELQVATLTDDSMTLYFSDEFEVRDGVAVTYVRVEGNRLARAQNTGIMTEIYPDVVEDGVINAADAYALAQGASAEVAFTPANDSKRVLGAAAARLLAEEEDERAYLHVDYLGSIVATTDEGGALASERAFYPSGEVRWEDGWVDRYGFTGQEHMDSGLIRFQFRHLDPHSSRWTSFDPAFMILDVAAMDRLGEATTGYAYVANNFTNLVDPLGLNSEEGGGQEEPGRPGEDGGYDVDQDFADEGDMDDDWEDDDDDGEVTPGGAFDGWDQDVVDNFISTPGGPDTNISSTNMEVISNMNRNVDNLFIDRGSPWGDGVNESVQQFENNMENMNREWDDSPLDRDDSGAPDGGPYLDKDSMSDDQKHTFKFVSIVLGSGFLTILGALAGMFAG